MKRGMVIDMNDRQLPAMAQLQGLPNSTVAVGFFWLAGEERYDFSARGMRRFGYCRLKRVREAVVLRLRLRQRLALTGLRPSPACLRLLCVPTASP